MPLDARREDIEQVRPRVHRDTPRAVTALMKSAYPHPRSRTTSVGAIQRGK
jgi:hypothetical protein